MDNDALDKLAQSEMDSSGIEFRDGNNQITTNSTGSNNNSSEFGSMSGNFSAIIIFLYISCQYRAHV